MNGGLVDRFDRLVADAPAQKVFHFYDSRGRETAATSRLELQRRSAGIARALKADHSVRSGDRIVLAYPVCSETIAAFFACLRVGAIPVPVPPLNQRAGADRIAGVLEDCAPRLALTSGNAKSKALTTLDTLSFSDCAVEDAPKHRATETDIAMLQYTSGSTSNPKGVMVTHANIIHNRSLVVDHDAPVAVTWLPQHHDMGLIGYYIYPLLSGGVVHGFSPSAFMIRPQLWLELITRVNATATSAPNFAFDYVLDRTDIGQLAQFDLSAMRFMMTAAEPVLPTSFTRFLRAMTQRGLDPEAFYVAYGLAEATLAVTSYGRSVYSFSRKDLQLGIARETTSASGVANAVKVMSCGRPLGETDISIVDPETKKRAMPGCVGEVWIGGNSVAAGYWGKEKETRDTFQNSLDNSEHKYLSTGDLGVIRDGQLVVCGRSSDLIIVRGQNYHPQDIEETLARSLTIPANSVAALPLTDEASDCVMLLVEGNGITEAQLEMASRAVRAENGLQVNEIILVGARRLPRTTSGKPMRSHIRGLLENGDLLIKLRWSANIKSDELQAPFQWLLERYELTGKETVSLTEIGVDSLDLVSIMHELQELIAGRDAAHIAEQVDGSLVQRMSVEQLIVLAELAEAAPDDLVSQLQEKIASARKAASEEDYTRMARDASIDLPAQSPRLALASDNDTVLLTGSTGFLGPFLLHELAQRGRKIETLVRGTNVEEASERLRRAILQSGLSSDQCDLIASRTQVVVGDLAQPNLGLDPYQYDRLAAETAEIVHNGAMVNYLFDYNRMRGANVVGTHNLLELAGKVRVKPLNHISTTFIFGWATKPVLLEADCNDEMQLLDFGYSQTKWCSDQLVVRAARAGMPVRIFRPALITPAVDGRGNAFDITIRLLHFMISHGIGVTARNQVSFTPVDVVAANVIAIAALDDTMGGTFHVVRDEFSTMTDVTDCISKQTGRKFDLHALDSFVPEVIRRCTQRDLLYPLLDFLVGSIDNIAGMEFKRYDSTAYQAARDRAGGIPDPSLGETVEGILRFMELQGLSDL